MRKFKFFIIFGLVFIGIILTVFLLKKISKSPADLAITNATIVTMNQKHDVINNGWIVINNGKISAVGEGKCCDNFKPKKIIDGQNKIVIPGMINTHSHSAMSLLKDQTTATSFEPWLAEVTTKEQQFKEEDIYQGSFLAIKEMLNSGIILTNDMYFFPEETIKASLEQGMRIMARIPVIKNEKGLSYDENFVSKYKNNPKVYLNFAPNPLEEYSLDELKWFAQKSIDLNIPIHIHLAEDTKADELLKNKFDLSPLELIQITGLIKTKLIIAHGITFTPDDIKTLSQYPNISISINPISNQLLSNTQPPIEKFLEAGINLGIGTDGSASSGGTLDLFAQMRYARLNSKVSLETLFSMATIGGAKTLGIDNQLGSLETGKYADMVLLNNSNGNRNIYDKIINNLSPKDVYKVFVAGIEIKK